jgi:prefoldin subunit 5
MRLRVKENERLVRDSSNLAILNTDREAIKAHERKMEQLKKVRTQEEQINTLKNDVSELKQLMQELLKRI